MKLSLKQMILASLFGVISGILMLFKFPIPITPTFMKIDFSDSALIIGGFLTGPIYSLLMIFIKWLIKIIISGTTSAYVGELSGIILNLSFVLPMSALYKKNKTKANAIMLMVVFSITTSFVAIITNIYMIFPLYGLNDSAIVSSFNKILPIINNMWQVMIFSILPFNIIKHGLNSVIAFILYKKISKGLDLIFK